MIFQYKIQWEIISNRYVGVTVHWAGGNKETKDHTKEIRGISQ
jgi:hypothetical protein